ncbi:hypothetical protein H6P81_019299 [Aristolochia fimbriata]|uniref:Enoyl reductase (ER) domain-containing protein n=1 Tax=Aristolochia fimbriata TaxID=158543 RepID=A0AAV7DT05_ARIFI|nr:hypothetical protein H6P81_019299 [Aristolochia fimbriata]
MFIFNLSRFGSFLALLLSWVRKLMAESSERSSSTTQEAFGWAARDASGILSPFHFTRRVTGEEDVRLKVLYCGVCHTDLHTARNDFGFSSYPIVLGHEITGVVTEVGSNVRKFKVGDTVGVGCLVDSCRTCENCKADLESYCPGQELTYTIFPTDGPVNHGGFSDVMVVNQDFVVGIPDKFPLDGAAPLLCAGITVYSPMRYFGLDRPGTRLGVVGLGGLGHAAVKFGKAFGANVTVISTSPSKEKEALQRLGADSFLVSRNPDQMQAAVGTLDGIIDTVAASHDLSQLIDLLKTNGKLVIVGAFLEPWQLPAIPMLNGRKLVAGSQIGGIKETHEMMNFAAEHNITADVEVIPMDYINTAMERLAKGDVKYRFVIDVGNTLMK